MAKELISRTKIHKKLSYELVFHLAYYMSLFFKSTGVWDSASRSPKEVY
jgi:hypothetical protein